MSEKNIKKTLHPKNKQINTQCLEAKNNKKLTKRRNEKIK
jgi:hypothetical protein